MIIYGVMTETSVGQLYIAGIVPGLMMTLFFAAYIVGHAVLWPQHAPRAVEAAVPLAERLRSLAEVGPIALLIAVVLGSMYAGVVTPTEAAALGAAAALVLALLTRGLSWRALGQAFHETVRTTSMVMLIIIFASIFSHVIALIGAPRALFELLTGSELPGWAVLALVFVFLVAIAYALEELSVMIIMLPVLFPLVTGLGYDPVWFGIVMVVWLEMGFITPPVGINLFVIQGVAPGSRMRDVAAGATPFVLLMALVEVLLFLVPDLALWLPARLATRP
jgi:C4-dicarboxylate transporter, DctM subunit